MTEQRGIPQLRNPRTVGRCSAPKCTDEGRLFPGGWFCTGHAPVSLRSAA